VKTYGGHAGKVEEFRREPPDLSLPCCAEGICDQHLGEYMASRGYYYESGRRYHAARERARARLNYMREHKLTSLAGVFLEGLRTDQPG
jgi:hypothetical protein